MGNPSSSSSLWNPSYKSNYTPNPNPSPFTLYFTLYIVLICKASKQANAHDTCNPKEKRKRERKKKGRRRVGLDSQERRKIETYLQNLFFRVHHHPTYNTIPIDFQGPRFFCLIQHSILMQMLRDRRVQTFTP